MTRLLIGEDGKLRPFWRAAIFYALTFWALPWLARPLLTALFIRIDLPPGLTPQLVAFVEAQYFLIALIPTAFFAWYEHRRIGDYGLPPAKALNAPTWEGIVAGAIVPGAVALGMLALGGMQIHGWAAPPSALALSMLAWALANVCVGIAEEFWFRGYFLQSLWRSIGFWPAALTVSAAFAALHYFAKPGENIWDVITLVWFSLLLCYSVKRTGTLWFAAGFHGAFDFMQLAVVGTPNGGQIPVGRLLDTSFSGPAWLTGGALGTEASLLIYPMLTLASLYVWLRYRGEQDRGDG
jgi:uncharacterized protein